MKKKINKTKVKTLAKVKPKKELKAVAQTRTFQVMIKQVSGKEVKGYGQFHVHPVLTDEQLNQILAILKLPLIC